MLGGVMLIQKQSS